MPEHNQKRPPSHWKQFLENSSFLREYLWKYRGLMSIGLLALLVVDALEVVPPFLLKRAVDVTISREPAELLLWIALGYVGVSFLQSICRYGWRMYLIRASILAGRDLRGKYVHHAFTLPLSFFDRTRIGDLMSLATSDVDAVRMALGSGLLTLADALIYFLLVPIAMLMLSPQLTVLALLPLPIIPWLVMRNERELHRRYERVQENLGKLSAQTQESLNGIRVTKAFAQEHVQQRRFEVASREYARLSLERAKIQVPFGPTLDFVMSLGMVLLLWVGGKMVIEGGDPATAVTLGTFVAFQRYIQKMVWPMAALGMAITSYQRAVSSSDRLKQILDEQTDVPESEAARLPETFVAARGRTPGGVQFHGLSFRFPGTERWVLKDIHLEISPGERVAFLGTIGAGKSALLSLLPRLYPVQRGMLRIDGVDINDWPIEELRRQVGYVSQDVFLFSESVTENVAFGMQGWMEQGRRFAPIEEAARLAGVHDDVQGLVESYETRLGERGVNLSGGQKQRLTIARALAKQPAILVLDDALSSVDVQTEELILKSLRSRSDRNTEIIAAHRISTIRDADRIVVIEGGQIRQVGNHTTLVEDRRGAYRRHYDQQQAQSELETYVQELDRANAEAPE